MKTTAAAANWCLASDVSIHKIRNKNVVVEYEFRIVLDKPLIDSLKKKHGTRWEEYYTAYDSENVLNYYRLKKVEERHEPQVGAFNVNAFLKHIRYGKS